MLTLGQTYTLRVLKMTEQGAYVDGEDLGEILLPTKFCPPGIGFPVKDKFFAGIAMEERQGRFKTEHFLYGHVYVAGFLAKQVHLVPVGYQCVHAAAQNVNRRSVTRCENEHAR